MRSMKFQKGDFAQQTIDFAQKINADLILIVTTKEHNICRLCCRRIGTVYYCQQLKNPGMLRQPEGIICQGWPVHGRMG